VCVCVLDVRSMSGDVRVLYLVCVCCACSMSGMR